MKSFSQNYQIPTAFYVDNTTQEKNECRRRKFTPQEDETLKLLIYKSGSFNWKRISEFMPGRSAKQCRDRYFNYLSEEITSDPWRKEEDEILLTYLSYIGTKWVEIARHLPGRSGNNVKNRWYKHLSKIYSYSPGKIIRLPNYYTKKKSKNNEKNCECVNQEYSIQSLLV